MSATTLLLYQHTDLSYAGFKSNFTYQGDDLYSLIFQRNRDKIKISTEKFAVKNLRKIFDATFQIVPKIGFQAMSLRDLSTSTGLSMGGLYSSISSKETIAIIVKDVVSIICADVVARSSQQKDPKLALEVLIRGYLYASTLMQPWFYFLYFETKCLPIPDQKASKNIELAQIKELESLISQLTRGYDGCHKSDFVATMTLALIQERYLKHWKYKKSAETIDDYADKCLQLIYRAICIDEIQPCSN